MDAGWTVQQPSGEVVMRYKIVTAAEAVAIVRTGDADGFRFSPTSSIASKIGYGGFLL